MKKFLTSALILFLHTSLSAQWIQLNGPTGGKINTIAGNGQNVFAGTVSAGVYHSPFNGAFWNFASTGLNPNYNVGSLAVSGTSMIAATSKYLYRSTDQGVTWSTTALNAATDGFINVTLIDNAFYASTSNHGIYKSVDDGISWTYSGAGIANAYQPNGLAKLGSELYASTYSGGIYKSTNGGSSWTSCNSGIPSLGVYSIACSNNFVFGGFSNGVYVSQNSGTTWNNMNNGLPSSLVNALLVKGNYLFAANQYGVYRYDLGGGLSGSWTLVDAGLGWGQTFCLYDDGTRLFAGCIDGVFISLDDGNTWQESNIGLKINVVTDFLKSGSHMYAASTLGVYDSQNGGVSWESLDLGSSQVQASKMVTAGPNLLASVYTAQFSEVRLSSDSGLTWSTVSGLPAGVAVFCLAANGSHVMAGTNGNGVYISYDNGLTWSPASMSPAGSAIFDISIAGQIGYAADFSNGLYQTNDGGQTWTLLTGAGLGSFRSVGTDGNTVIAYETNAGFIISLNNGISWNPVSNLQGSAYGRDYIIDGNQIVLASDSGVYVSNDLGQTWGIFNTGLISTRITQLYKEGSRIYAATIGSSVFYNDNLLTGLSHHSFINTEMQLYPNPLSGSLLHIKYSGEAPEKRACFELINIQGQCIQKMFVKLPDSNIELMDVTPGLYTVRITDSNNVWYQKLLVADH